MTTIVIVSLFDERKIVMETKNKGTLDKVNRQLPVITFAFSSDSDLH